MATKTTRRKQQKPWLMRRHKGKGHVDTRRAPKWWLSRPDEVTDFLRSLKGVEVSEIGRSAGGRPIIAASWGEREDLKGRTSTTLASAISGGAPSAFYGKGKRERPGFMFIGAAHGSEIEGTVAALNFLNVVVTGKDLSGRRWPQMAEEGRKLRIVVIPFLNIDGRTRCSVNRHFIDVSADAYRHITQGEWRSGKKMAWPTSKLHHPVPLKKVDPLGTYYNDNGVNLVYDSGIGDECQPETRALVRFLREEMPDCVLCSHTDSGSLVCEPSSFIPRHYRQRLAQVSAAVALRCKKENAAKSRMMVETDCYAGQVFYQTDMIYHCCGAFPVLVEFPCGYQGCPGTHREILDIGMYVIEEIIAFGNAEGFRPPDPKWHCAEL